MTNNDNFDISISVYLGISLIRSFLKGFKILIFNYLVFEIELFSVRYQDFLKGRSTVTNHVYIN